MLCFVKSTNEEMFADITNFCPLTRITIALLLSVLIAWGIGAVALTSPTVCVTNQTLGMAVPKAGSYKQEREENWVSFHYGEEGLEASDALRARQEGEKALLFGDSYVEASMVAPQERMQARLSESGLPCIGIGISGNSCVEYHHLMGIYNQLISNVTTNIILIADISDILPPKGTTDFLSLKPSYPFRKVEGRLGELSYRFRLMAFRNVLKKTMTAWHNGLDWRGNHWLKLKADDTLEEPVDTSHYEEYWKNMLSALKTKAPQGRLMVVYAPIVPSIRDNAISTKNDDEELIQRFANVCRSYDLIGGGIVDVSEKLCDYTSQTKRFPRGFFNTRPGAGHLNSEGHRLVAEAIREVLAP